MTLSGPVAKQLRQAIEDAFTAFDLTMLVREDLGKGLDEIVARSGSTYTYVVFQLIDWAERHDRLLDLVSAIAVSRPNSVKIQNVVALVQSQFQPSVAIVTRATPVVPPPAAAPPGYPEVLFIGRQPFINRRHLKASLEEMVDPQTGMRRGIIINGAEGTGKTFSWYRFKLAGQRDKSAISAVIKIAQWSEMSCTPDDLCEEIARQLNLDLSTLRPDTQATPARRALQLRGWLLQNLKAKQPTWIFIDGLSHPCMAPGTRELAIHILTLASDGLVPELRVALAECGHALDQGLLSQVLDDSLAGLTKNDVVEHVKEAITALGAALPDTMAMAFADKVFDGLPDPLGHKGMAELIKRYGDLYPKLLASGQTS